MARQENSHRAAGTANTAMAEVRDPATQDFVAVSEPGPRTQARIEAAKRRTKARPIRPEVKIVTHEGQKAQIEPVHADSEGHGFHFLDAFGTSSQPFAEAMLGQLASVVRSNADGIEEASLNAGLAAVDGIAPQNEAEAMLAVQMAGTHSVAMEMLRRAKFATSTPALGIREPRDQASAHLHGPDGMPGQGSAPRRAEGHGRACARLSRRTGGCWQCHSDRQPGGGRSRK